MAKNTIYSGWILMVTPDSSLKDSRRNAKSRKTGVAKKKTGLKDSLPSGIYLQ
jgi:hypothetical protein